MSACTACDSGYFGPTCDSKCDTNCYECNKIKGACSKCETDFNWSGSSLCVPCNGSCTECTYSDISSCSACSTGCYLHTSTCIRCDDECVSCNGADTCNECINGYFKSNSQRCEKCPLLCKTCTSASQCTACVDGHYGLICNNDCMDSCLICNNPDNCTECAEFRYSSIGNSSSLTCHCDKRRCSNQIGDTCKSCNNPTWYPSGPGCCPCGEGRYVDNGRCVHCSEYCLPQGQCNQTNGACNGGCESGWLGTKCDQRCTDQCINCSSLSGTCGSCKAGYYGDTCQFGCNSNCLEINSELQCHTTTGACDGCRLGFFGDKCEHQCSRNCLHTEAGLNCEKTTGECDVCRAGFYGSRCTEVCSEGCDVNENDVRWCQKEDGACHHGCLDGFTGRTCSKTLSSGQEPSNTGTIVGLVVGSIACVALIVLVVVAILIFRRKQLLCQTPVSREDSNEHGNTENTDPTLSQYEDLRYRPGNDTLYSHLGIDNNTGEENASRPQYENVQERAVNETNAPVVRQYENFVL